MKNVRYFKNEIFFNYIRSKQLGGGGGYDDDSSSVRRDKKLPNVYKSCPKMISLEKWLILTPLQKLPKIVGYLGKLIVAKGFEKLPKVQ